MFNAGRDGREEISFQHFKNHLLAKKAVTKLEVVNKSYVKVYVNDARAKAEADSASTMSDMSESGSSGSIGRYQFYFTIGSVESFERKLDDAMDELNYDPREFVPVRYISEFSWQNELVRFLPTILLLAGYVYLTRRQMGGFGGVGPGSSGNNIFNVGKANVTMANKNQKKVKFTDVAGCDEAKQEIMEFVDFLKDPQKYEELGAKIPRGALLVGPPGTGKTLLAKATAGEANVPFLSISGSDFMEMFVGVGPSRVRDLFAQARNQQPSIIFIDEIDAIGRQRGR